MDYPGHGTLRPMNVSMILLMPSYAFSTLSTQPAPQYMYQMPIYPSSLIICVGHSCPYSSVLCSSAAAAPDRLCSGPTSVRAAPGDVRTSSSNVSAATTDHCPRTAKEGYV